MVNKRGPGRPAKSASVKVNEPINLGSGTGVTVKEVEEAKPTPILIEYYNMYTDAISCGKPDNLEAVNVIKRPENGLVSAVDLVAAGVDVEWLKSIGILESYGYLPTF